MPRFCLIILTFWALLIACEEDDTFDPASLEPFVNVSFFKADTLQSLTITGVSSFEGIATISFPDSATVFKLPLSITSDQVTFFINRNGLMDTLAVGYDRNITNHNNSIIFTLFETRVLEHSFDSVKVVCDSLCISNESQINLHF